MDVNTDRFGNWPEGVLSSEDDCRSRMTSGNEVPEIDRLRRDAEGRRDVLEVLWKPFRSNTLGLRRRVWWANPDPGADPGTPLELDGAVAGLGEGVLAPVLGLELLIDEAGDIVGVPGRDDFGNEDLNEATRLSRLLIWSSMPWIFRNDLDDVIRDTLAPDARFPYFEVEEDNDGEVDELGEEAETVTLDTAEDADATLYEGTRWPALVVVEGGDEC